MGVGVLGQRRRLRGMSRAPHRLIAPHVRREGLASQREKGLTYDQDTMESNTVRAGDRRDGNFFNTNGARHCQGDRPERPADGMPVRQPMRYLEQLRQQVMRRLRQYELL